MDRYLGLLLQANEQLNLTRITDPQAAQLQHVADALTLLPYIPTDAAEIADIVSGGGVPGIPLAIAIPTAHVVLIESTRKKASFLRDAARELGLNNVEVLDTRAELVARGPRREHFDIVTARAVGALAWLAEWCLPLTKKGGAVLAMKGARIVEELPAASKAIRLLGGAEPRVHPVDQLPGAEHHVIVEIRKASSTDRKYPRDPTATHGNPMS